MWHRCLIAGGVASEGELGEIDAAIQQEVEDAVRFAEGRRAPGPTRTTACDHIYSTP